MNLRKSAQALTALQPYVNTSGLVLLYHFNNETGENDSLVKDFSVEVNSERAGSSRNNGTLLGGAFINRTQPKFGSGALYMAPTQVVNFSNETLVVNNGSYSLWFKTSVNTGADPELIEIGNGDNNRAVLYLSLTQSYNIRFIGVRSGSNIFDLQSTTPPNNGQWHHAGATWNTNTAFLYLDGVQIATEAVGDNSLSLSGSLNLVITNPEGNLLIKNALTQSLASISPTLKSFVIQNNTGATVAYVNSTGGLFLIGSLTQGVEFS